MPRIVWEGSPSGEWNPLFDEIQLPKLRKYKEHLPLVTAHEIAHYQLGQTINESPLVKVVEERDAWMAALSRMAPEEVDVDFINSCIGTYVRDVRDTYNEDSWQYTEAKRMRRQLRDFALKRKRNG